MIILGVDVLDKSIIRGLGRKFGGFQKQAIREGVEDWHSHTLAKHFTPGNRGRYRIAVRSQLYTKEIKPAKGTGQGRYVDLQLSGKSRRFMQAFYTITGSKDRMTLTMKPPGYFTNPFIGSWTDPDTGKTKRITRQPNKPDEATQTNNEDRERIRRVVNDRLLALVNAAQAERRTRVS